jgi:hypothetical protein
VRGSVSYLRKDRRLINRSFVALYRQIRDPLKHYIHVCKAVFGYLTSIFNQRENMATGAAEDIYHTIPDESRSSDSSLSTDVSAGVGASREGSSGESDCSRAGTSSKMDASLGSSPQGREVGSSSHARGSGSSAGGEGSSSNGTGSDSSAGEGSTLSGGSSDSLGSPSNAAGSGSLGSSTNAHLSGQLHPSSSAAPCCAFLDCLCGLYSEELYEYYCPSYSRDKPVKIQRQENTYSTSTMIFPTCFWSH